MTLLALVTALGVRRGLVGLVWGVTGVLLCLLLGSFISEPLLAAALALLLSGGVAYGAARLVPEPYAQPWHSLVGGLGGFMLGTVLLAAFALSFPTDKDAAGKVAYPSKQLPTTLYDAIQDSALRTELDSVWERGASFKALLIPDQLR